MIDRCSSHLASAECFAENAEEEVKVLSRTNLLNNTFDPFN